MELSRVSKKFLTNVPARVTCMPNQQSGSMKKENGFDSMVGSPLIISW